MKKVLGGKEKSCINCGGTMIHLKVKGLGVVSQCRARKKLVNGKIKDEVRVWSYDPITKEVINS